MRIPSFETRTNEENEEVYPCPFCRREFKTYQSWHTHARVRHRFLKLMPLNMTEDSRRCPDCQGIFKDEGNLIRHQRRYHYAGINQTQGSLKEITRTSAYSKAKQALEKSVDGQRGLFNPKRTAEQLGYDKPIDGNAVRFLKRVK